MLSECFIASTLASAKTPASASLRDVGICLHELQPSATLRSTFKRSSTAPNCLAVTASHIFAAQSEKATVHVYSRDKGNQEATVPFHERIRSIAVVGSKNGDIVVLGTEGGRLILWEVCTGRQVVTTASHLRPVTAVAVDPTSNFILSGSADATIHVWSLVDLLSFTKPPSGRERQPPNSPLRTFSNHRAAVTAIAVGHSTGRYNIVVSTAQDNTAIAWDYQTGHVLRNFLLPANAVSLSLDPVDRAFYVGYEDGSLQSVDFYKDQSVQHPLHDPSLQTTPAQIPAEERWLPPSADSGAAHTLTLSYDGMVLLSGHENGKVYSWNVGRRKYASTIADLTHPVTNVIMQPLSGLYQQAASLKRVSHTIVKPRFDHSLSENSQFAGTIPADYEFNTHILPDATSAGPDWFMNAFSNASFPTSMLEQGLAELATVGQPASAATATSSNVAMDIDDSAKDSQIADLESEIANLKQKVSVSQIARQVTIEEVTKLRSDLANLHDYINELQEKQEQSHREKIQREARKEERAARRREAWFAAEKKGKNGDTALRRLDVEEGSETSGTDDHSSDE
ncbi:Putative Ribosomal assembly complex component Ipi3 [Aspergillus calidoustus]|uniref:Pre-rRNA-processing protein IPI3 n=1 Tax=Aspergillus calidoustus TaxID=454130 RepID=A0A0U5G999_ASPCI|nr:Putative Ribosomal assembly complex component Ipi3 [Aspergillus calidoustus]